MTDEMRLKFGAAVCVEIFDIPAFCAAIEAALPSEAKFPGRRGRTRIGHRVEYYRESDDCNPRWALPDVIATSKSQDYVWQDEFRLVFSLTGALGFEKVSMRVAPRSAKRASSVTGHKPYMVKVPAGLAEICVLHIL